MTNQTKNNVFEEAGPSKQSSHERDPEPASPSNIDQGQPRNCPSCSKNHFGSSQLGIFCPECEHDKIQNDELQLPEEPQHAEERPRQAVKP